LGLSPAFTQAQAEAFLTAAGSNRVGAMMDLATALYSYNGTDAALLTAKTSYQAKIMASDVYSSNSMNKYGEAINTSAGQTMALTTGFDSLMGTAMADTFLGRSVGNSNTLNDGDRLDGGAGTDTLIVDFLSQGNAITPVLSNIETVVIRAQSAGSDANGTGSTDGNNQLNSQTVQIDAQRSVAVDSMDKVTAAAGVTRWESNNSRSDVIVEDVRIGNSHKTKDVTIAMVETDPGNVDFGVYFDQLSLRNSGGGTSTLTIRVIDTGAANTDSTKPLLNNPYDTFKIGVNGVLQSINLNPTGNTTAAAGADTYAALLTLFQTSLAAGGAATAALGSDFSVIDPLSGNTVTGKDIILTGAAGMVFSTVAGSGWVNTTGAAVPNNSNIYTFFDTGSTSVTELVTSTIVLDDVGRGSTGGDLVVGGMSVGATSTSRGVERFEITVQDNSKLQTITSTNNALREVTIVNGTTSSSVKDAYTTTVTNAGNLTVNGTVTSPLVGDTALVGTDTGAGANNAHSSDDAAGFTDVRLIDASAMTGKLEFKAEVTSDSIAKYITLVDTASSPTADVAGTGNVNFNVPGANFIYTGGTNNDTMVVNVDNAVAASRSSVLSGQSDFTFNVSGGTGNDAITFNMIDSSVAVGTGQNTLFGGAEAWYTNQVLNANVTINGGAGNDTIRTPGAGNIIINGDDGNDVIYTDNTGAVWTQTFVTAQAAAANSKQESTARWVYNTADQTTALAAARNVGDLISSSNSSYAWYGVTTTVTYLGLTATATVANTSYKSTDLQINQAIKSAINNDAVLSKLLVAQDGPANTLVVTALSDGARVVGNLDVAFTAPTAASLTSTIVTAFNTANGTAHADGTALNAAITGTFAAITAGDYFDAFATSTYDGTAVPVAAAVIDGANSLSTSDNTITPGVGDDVIVLGTTVGASAVLSSNEVVVYTAAFGNDVIVNFAAGAVFNADVLHLRTFLGSTATSLDNNAGVAGAVASTDSLIAIFNFDNTGTALTGVRNDSAAEVAKLYTDDVTANKGVYISVAATNIGTVYQVVDGTGAADLAVTLLGTIDLADTAWNTLILANFA